MKHSPALNWNPVGGDWGCRGYLSGEGPDFAATSFLLVPGTPNTEGWLPWGQWA